MHADEYQRLFHEDDDLGVAVAGDSTKSQVRVHQVIESLAMQLSDSEQPMYY
jgi:hypothetical protein